jgi:hypothetical protein
MDWDRKKNLARTMNRLGKSSHIMVEILTWLDPKDLLQMNVVNAAFYEKHVPLTMRILRLKLPSMLTNFMKVIPTDACGRIRRSMMR